MSLTLEHVRQLPKLELHRHVDGSVDPALVWELCHEQGVQLKQANVEELRQFLKLEAHMQMGEVMEKFGLPIQLMQNRQSISKVFRHQVLDLHKENIIYAELRFAPQYHTQKGLTLDQVIQAAVDGIDEGVQQCQGETLAKLIVSIGRECPSVESNRIVDTVLSFEKTGMVVGIDLACNEEAYPPEIHQEAYSKTFGTSIQRTVHAGELDDESKGRDNILSSIKNLRANRIGHGIYIPRYSDLIKLCLNHKVSVECCPVSNLVVVDSVTDMGQLYLDKLRASSIPFSVNSDDPALFHCSLSETLYQTAVYYGWTLYDLQQLMISTVDQTFLSQEDKSKLLTNLQSKKLV